MPSRAPSPGDGPRALPPTVRRLSGPARGSARRALAAGIAAGALLCTQRLSAQGIPVTGAARLSVSPVATSGISGSTSQFVLRVDLSGVSGIGANGSPTPAVLGGYLIKVEFDRTRMRFDSAVGGPATGFGAAPIFTDPAVANAVGSVTLAAGQTSSSAPVGLVPVAVLSFTNLAPGSAGVLPQALSLSTAFLPGPPPVAGSSMASAGAAFLFAIDSRSGAVDPAGLSSDSSAGAGSNGNGVLEPGEQVTVAPAWKNISGSAEGLSGSATAFVGPGGARYTLADSSAGYGSPGAGATADCLTATGNCYVLSVSAPATRPATHWDAYLTETVGVGDVKVWPVHVGGSFTDVPANHLFYRAIETVLHNGITSGCNGTGFCPESAVTRAQMAVFLLRGAHGSVYQPLPASGTVFSDVAAGAFAAGWIERMAAEGITGGCGNGKFCPDSTVTRGAMAVLLLKAEHGSGFQPAAATGLFSDVPVSDPFARWIEQLSREGITGGCGGGKFCPASVITRGQMAAFLKKGFQLAL